ncbi:MAG: four helix bundle protein [Bacteroidota bacterium]
MAKVDKFEDLICWQKARLLVKEIYQAINKGDFSKDYDVKSQIRRASLSSMSNIAEGFGRFSKKEFVRFLEISTSSASEVKSILYVALDLGYLPKDQVQSLQSLTEEVKALGLGLIKYLNTRK